MPSLATVILAMDNIDETLINNSLDPEFEPSIHAVLGIAKKTLNKYYNATDQSEVYRIAMGMCFPSAYIIITCTDMPPSFQSYILATNFNTSNVLVGSQIGSRQWKK